MALARKCDACGKLYEEYGKRFHDMDKINGIVIAGVNDRGGFDAYYVMDLCPECLWSVLDHINVLKGLPSELKL